MYVCSFIPVRLYCQNALTIPTERKKQMKKNCSTCDFGEINFWGNRECFKFITNIDNQTTFFTSYREKDAVRLNSDGCCVWFKRTSWFRKILDKIEIWIWSD